MIMHEEVAPLSSPCCTAVMGHDYICPECGGDWWGEPYPDESREMFEARLDDGLRRDPAARVDG